MQELQSAIDKLKEYFAENSIAFFQPVYSRGKATIVFEAPVQSYVDENTLEKNFSFELTIWESDKDHSITCGIETARKAKIPFHPNFSAKPWFVHSSSVEWIGFDPGISDPVRYVDQMIHSLVYHRDYVKIQTKVGNEKALKWYLTEFHNNSDKFPTDHSFPKKHFQVNNPGQQSDKKKFEVKPENGPPKKKFAIFQEVNVSPTEQPRPDFAVEASLNSRIERNESNARLYISNLARTQIFEHIQWGNLDARQSRSEQGGLLLGKVHVDRNTGQLFGVAERAVPGESAIGSATYLEMTHTTWAEMINKVDQLIDREENKDLLIIGWYHTHPNHLDVFMSGTDLNTQHNYFNKDWHFAIVLNPQRQIWKAFCGPGARERSGFFLKGDPLPRQDMQQTASPQPGNISDTGRQPADSGKSNLFNTVLLFVLVISVGLVLWFGSGTGTSDAASGISAKDQPAEKKPSVRPTATTKTPAPESPATESEIAWAENILDTGTIIRNQSMAPVFKKSLAFPLTVLESIGNHDTATIIADLFAYKNVVSFMDDSSLKIIDKLRNTHSAGSGTLVGEIADSVIVAC